MDLLPSIDSIGAFGLLALGFGFVIFVHELGHFLVAKAVGIKVTQFAIGFGQSLLTFRKGLGVRVGTTEPEYEKRIREWLMQHEDIDEKSEVTTAQLDKATQALGLSETEYRFNWMPLGGYVKMLGQEDLNPDAQSDDPRSYNNKPVSARAAVISAGVIMNMIFALIFFTICFLWGVEFPPAIVGDTMPESPAATTYAVGHENDRAYRGLRPGDPVTHIDDVPIADFTEIRLASALASRGDKLKFTVLRDGKKLDYLIEPKAAEYSQGMLAVGIGLPVSNRLVEYENGIDARLEAKGLQANMIAANVDGHAVERHDQLEEQVAKAIGGPVSVEFVNEAGESRKLEVQAEPILRPGNVKKQIPTHFATLSYAPVVKVTALLANSEAERMGLKKGDILARVAGVAFPTDLQAINLIQAHKARPISIIVRRDGKEVELKGTPDQEGKLGFGLGLDDETTLIARVLPTSPLNALSLTPGSSIVSVNGVPTATPRALQRELQLAARKHAGSDNAKKPLVVDVTYRLLLGSEPRELSRKLSIDAKAADRLSDAEWTVPDLLSRGHFEVLKIPIKQDSPFAAAWLGVEKTHQFMLQTYVTIARLFEGTVKMSHLRGPVGIADEGTKVAKQDWPYLLFFLGLISVNLAVINFLPIPIVDGGHMVFLIIEKIKGSPVSVKIQNAATMVGLALIGSIFLITLFYDVTRLIGVGT